MKYSIFALLVLIELMLTACGPVNIAPDATVVTPPTTGASPTPGITLVHTLTCNGANSGFRASPNIVITFSYQEILYSDDHKQITCSITSNKPDNSQVSGSSSRLVSKTDSGYDQGLCVAYADIDNSTGRWSFRGDIKQLIYSGNAQTVLGGVLDITSYCH